MAADSVHSLFAFKFPFNRGSATLGLIRLPLARVRPERRLLCLEAPHLHPVQAAKRANQ